MTRRSTRSLGWLLFVGGLACGGPLHELSAQDTARPRQSDADRAKLIALRDKKLESEFLRRAEWHSDLSKAKASAAARSKDSVARPILMYFTRSFAPSPASDQLESGLFLSEAFTSLGSEVVLYCHVTSKVDTDPDQDLLARMGGDSFPFVVVTDEAGRRIASTGRIVSIADIRSLLDKEVAPFLALRQKASKGDKAAKADYLFRRLALGHLSPSEVEKELEAADYLTADQQKSLRQSLAGLEVMGILAATDSADPKSRSRASERFHQMFKAGRIPAGKLAFPFWQVLIARAHRLEDVDLFETALRSVKNLPDVKIDQKWVTRMDARLRALRFMKRTKRKDG